MTDASTAPRPAAPSADTAFLGHPRGLAVLFFAEVWERFSYYGMRAMLVTYLVWHYLNAEEHAYGIYAAYAGMIYLTPVLGGWLADRYLGARKAVTFGAILITLGHFTMAWEGAAPVETLTAGGRTYTIDRIRNPEGNNPQFIRTITIDGAAHRIERIGAAEDGAGDARTVTYRTDGGAATLTGTLFRKADLTGQNLTFLALALIIVGTGFLKANISAIVGSLYEQGDRRRDAGFTIFYFGINAGALMGQLSVAWAAIAYGWSYGFGLAGVGMLLGLITFLAWQRLLEGRADPPDAAALRQPVLGPLSREWLIYLGGFAAVGLSWLVVRYMGQYSVLDLVTLAGIGVKDAELLGKFTLFDLAANLIFFLCVLGVFLYAALRLGKEDRDRMIVLLTVTVFSVIFWTGFDQAPTSLIIFQSKYVDTWIFNAQQVGFFNAFFILTLAPVFTLLWTALGKAGREPATPTKFALGLMQMGLAYFVINAAIALDGGDLSIGIFWLALMYFLHTTAEFCISPIGLSAVTKLSLKQMVGFMMGVWFLAISISQVWAAMVAKATSTPEGTDPAVALAQFNIVYFWFAVTCVGAGLLLLLAAPALKRMMHGRL